jgi:uncharacterized integral membrane protein
MDAGTGGGDVTAQQEPSPQTESTKVQGKRLVGLGIVVLALIFVFQNTESGQVQLYFWEIEAPTWVWLISLFGGGVIVGSMFPWFGRRKAKTKQPPPHVTEPVVPPTP